MDVASFLISGAFVPLSRKTLLVGWGSFVRSETPLATSFYFPDFFLSEKKPWITFSDTSRVSPRDLLENLPDSSRSGLRPIWQGPDKAKYKKGFDSLQTLIASGELEKGVPYQFACSSANMNPSLLISSLTRLLRFAEEKPVNPYGFWSDSQGVLGASPELLFRVEGEKHLETMACAGTLGHQQDVDAFIQDPKELSEHGCVVNGIQESLSPYGKVRCGRLHPLDLGHLVHLATPIEVDLDHAPNLNELIRALHPTPALGTFPKQAGKNWLREIHGLVPRGRYGAPAGAVYPEGASFYVGIRNVQWETSGMRIGAGGGVNRLSNFEREWQEIKRKLTAVKEALSLG